MSVRDVIQAAAGASTTADKTYIEDVFSTYLFNGTGAAQTITNGIDLAGKGGMVWAQFRDQAGNNNEVKDSARGFNNASLRTNTTDAAYGGSSSITGATSTGFTADSWYGSGSKIVSWTFRKAPKFFDVVTFTGNTTFNHSLGATPGMIVIKSTGISQDWWVWHRSLGNSSYVVMNTTASSAAFSNWCIPTSTSVTVSGLSAAATYVAYLFAHDTTTDGLIQCGSFTAGASGFNEVNLGWEPQYILFKTASVSQNWYVFDTMRGMALTSSKGLSPNLSNAELDFSSSSYVYPTAKGFAGSGDFFGNGANVIYMAIRRGPMRTPTDGTKVFEPQVYTADNTKSRTFTNSGGFVTDAVLTKNRSANDGVWMINRLVGNEVLRPWTTEAGNSSYSGLSFAVQNGYSNSTASVNYYYWNDSSRSNVQYYFKRAPGFFDVVCYTGTGVARTVNHNLGVAPELMIVKDRNNNSGWFVYNKDVGNDKTLLLHSTSAAYSTAQWNNTSPTSAVFNLNNFNSINTNTVTYVAYLFASCPGVSKVGNYTGNGSSQTINCGFSAGARFVLVKCTTAAGGWVVFDTARGITSGTDPLLLLNVTNAEQSSVDYINPASSGFTIKGDWTAVNETGQTYIYLAIA